MTEPRVIPRADHTLSRADVDPDALKVLYRLQHAGHIAYLVGGGVRDLLLGRRPKDFDIGTSAHPGQVKKLFRNCWIIGRRFRLAHVKFGTKVIEVATFRRQVADGEEVVGDGVPAPLPAVDDLQPVHHDNTFGTPEQDAFRRDFTINALFYDIATHAIIDYVGGLDDLHAGVLRCIGEPDVRFTEDPVRMMRAVVLSARLGFTIDRPILDSIARLRHDIAKASMARLIEEYYKVLRTGASLRTFRALIDAGLLEPITPELHAGAGDALWRSLEALDRFRQRSQDPPDTLTNAILLGTLLVPLGLAPSLSRPPLREDDDRRKRPPIGAQLGTLPLARRDVDELRNILAMQRRLLDLDASPRAQLALTYRHAFHDALTWLEIHGDAPDAVEHWMSVLAERNLEDPPEGAEGDLAGPPRALAEAPDAPKRRRRRRRRRTPPAA